MWAKKLNKLASDSKKFSSLVFKSTCLSTKLVCLINYNSTCDLQLITVVITCITANGKPITNVGADNICQVTIIHFAHQFLATVSLKQ